ncbi:hypothetical protein [Spiroplasma endosymbiont of Asaphidion curtum]|uniref:hypothetical protein n=1 Tax=Spiroplasma endosymbiont of Asaphidion curtum TaxID=3066281 RepID=UPI00313D3D35
MDFTINTNSSNYSEIELNNKITNDKKPQEQQAREQKQQEKEKSRKRKKTTKTAMINWIITWI